MPWRSIANRVALSRRICQLLLVTTCVAGGWAPAARAEADPKWQADMRRFAAEDARTPPPRQPILFVGSSSIRLWNLAESFPMLPALNRGFGGAQISDVIDYYDQVVAPYRPRMIVFYSGDNDLASGKSPRQVADDFARFLARVRSNLPQTRVLFISIKPSVARWQLIDKIRQANALVAKMAEQDRYMTFINIHPRMLGADARPRADLLQADGLHLNDEGYRVWTSAITPHVRPTRDEIEEEDDSAE